jgi:hypothetical protein
MLNVRLQQMAFMHFLRLLLLGIAVMFLLFFGVPMALHTLICEWLPFGPCPNSPYLPILGLMVDHREAWLTASVAYALALCALFGGAVRLEILRISFARIGVKLLWLIPVVIVGAYALLRFR